MSDSSVCATSQRWPNREIRPCLGSEWFRLTAGLSALEARRAAAHVALVAELMGGDAYTFLIGGAYDVTIAIDAHDAAVGASVATKRA